MGYRRTPTAPLPPEVLKTLYAKNPVLRERDFLPKASKYGNKRVEVDGITFDSQISDLKLQPRFPFYYQTGWTSELMFTYVADFSYVDNVPPHPMTVVEDVKGFRTPLYRLKKKLIEAQYGIAITEIPA
jgi:hypothetical protein